ncbi:hypothetical protein KIOSHI_203 [Bacillus phage Kioshi]|nr:hypothetical protein KIOSHI_203 [Bacillus phage Kioshi]
MRVLGSGKGNREEAIRLLKKTSLTIREISDKTGVPTGTLGTWSAEYRPKHISKNNQYMGSLKGGATTKQLQKGKNKQGQSTPQKDKVVLPTFHDFTEEKKDEILIGFDTETNVGEYIFDFHFRINTFETNITKEEAVSRLRYAIDILESIPPTTVSLNLSVNKGEK